MRSKMLQSSLLLPKTKALLLACCSLARGEAGSLCSFPCPAPGGLCPGLLSLPIRGAVVAPVWRVPEGLEQHSGSTATGLPAPVPPSREPTAAPGRRVVGPGWPQPPLASLLVSAPCALPKSKHGQEAPASLETRTVGRGGFPGLCSGSGGQRSTRGHTGLTLHSITCSIICQICS